MMNLIDFIWDLSIFWGVFFLLCKVHSLECMLRNHVFKEYDEK